MSPIDLNPLFRLGPYSLPRTEKTPLFFEYFYSLNKYHYENCLEYRRIIDLIEADFHSISTTEQFPFLPSTIFKYHHLVSAKNSAKLKTLSSSGTTGNLVSKVHLDNTTSKNQRKVLSRIAADFFGNRRYPLLIIDQKVVNNKSTSISARQAAIRGFSLLGFDVTYALTADMSIDYPLLLEFIEKYRDKPILIFGFTSIFWEYFLKVFRQSDHSQLFPNAMLLHGGGWKKLHDQAIDNNSFKESIRKELGIEKIHNYYGMVEQTGSIFMECDVGYFHCSIYSDIITRRNDFSVCNFHEQGIIQIMSILPFSYPGHSILSEDLGTICGEDDCPCGRSGKYFYVHGRVPNAELRGCSDLFL